MGDAIATFVVFSAVIIPLALVFRGVPIEQLFERKSCSRIWKIASLVVFGGLTASAFADVIARHVYGIRLRFGEVSLVDFWAMAMFLFFWVRCVFLLAQKRTV